MAKYSNELFDEIIAEMMREKKTLMEMMAELDCDDQAIYDSQTRIAKKQQTASMMEARLNKAQEKAAGGDAAEAKPKAEAAKPKGADVTKPKAEAKKGK